MSERCYYEILQIERSATKDEIRKAYKRECLRNHPDKNLANMAAAEESFKAVQSAYAVLSDTDRRKAYDLYGHSGAPAAPNDWPRYRQQEQQYHHEQRQPRRSSSHFDPWGGTDPFAGFFEGSLFGSMFGDPHAGRARAGRGSSGRQHNLFSDPFFGGGLFEDAFGGMAGFENLHSRANNDSHSSSHTYNISNPASTSRNSNISTWGGGRGTSTSTRTQVYTDSEGVRRTVTEHTVHHADGTSETTVQESSSNGSSSGRYLDGGQQQQQQQRQSQRHGHHRSMLF